MSLTLATTWVKGACERSCVMLGGPSSRPSFAPLRGGVPGTGQESATCLAWRKRGLSPCRRQDPLFLLSVSGICCEAKCPRERKWGWGHSPIALVYGVPTNPLQVVAPTGADTYTP